MFSRTRRWCSFYYGLCSWRDVRVVANLELCRTLHCSTVAEKSSNLQPVPRILQQRWFDRYQNAFITYCRPIFGCCSTVVMLTLFLGFDCLLTFEMRLLQNIRKPFTRIIFRKIAIIHTNQFVLSWRKKPDLKPVERRRLKLVITLPVIFLSPQR